MTGRKQISKPWLFCCLLASMQCLLASGNTKKTTICQASSQIFHNATLKGGMRGKTIQYIGKVSTIESCVKEVCDIEATNYAFILKNHCYAVTCLSECEPVTGRFKQATKLIEVERTTYMSEEHRIVSDVFRPVKHKDTRPKLSAEQIMNVSLNVRLIQILDVDAVGQSIKLNVWTTQEWRNPLFAWDDKMYDNVSLVNVKPDLVWTPVLLLYNNADNSMNSVHTMKTKVIANSSGYNTWFASTSIKASCNINVKYFPFDEQICYLNFGSWTNGIDEMDITPFGMKNGLHHYTENSEWEVVKFTVKKEIKKYKCCKYPFAEVVYKLHIRRKTLYYIYTMILPSATITALISIGFCLPPNSGERITLSITTLVSMTVYLNLASKKLPATSENIPLLSLFYFLLLVQISLSVAASTFVLMFFYRQNFLEPMPAWIRHIIIERLGKILCGVYLPNRPLLKVKRRRKTVRFSDVVTVSGNQSPVGRKKNSDVMKGELKSPLLEKQPDAPAFTHHTSQSTRKDVITDKDLTPVNGSAHSLDRLKSRVDDMTYQSGSMFNFHTIQEPDRKHIQNIMDNDVDTITKSVDKKQQNRNERYEWEYVSMVIDRLFLIMFVLTLTISVCFLMLHKKQQSAKE